MARRLRAVAEQAEDGQPLRDWMGDLPDTFLLCRDIGHSWRPLTASIYSDGYQRVMRCPRCRTERHQWLSMRGHVQGSSYIYPEGYQAPKGTGYLAGEQRDGLRLESVLRLIAKEDGS